MSITSMQSAVETPSHSFFRQSIELLNRAGIPFLIGGAFAFVHQTGIDKSTKDLDIFVRPADVPRLLEVCRRAGLEADVVFSHWLAKIRSAEGFIDVIYNSGNGNAVVDDGWFEHARSAELLGLPVQIAPVEETVWSKAYVMERERFDGADVAHILLAHAPDLDWRRLIDRFGSSWRVLFAHLVLFGFIYPSERARVPGWVMHELTERLTAEIDAPPASERVCYGTLLSWSQYLGDVLSGDYRDARIRPFGTMTAHEVARWTAADKG